MEDTTQDLPEASAPEGEQQVQDAGGAVETTPEERQPLSLDDAFAQAQAEHTAAADTQEQQTTDGQPAGERQGDAEPEGEQSEGSQGKGPTVEAELDRIYSYIKQGRVNELPPALRGRAQAIQRDVIAAHQKDQAEESEFRQLYLSLEAQRVEDPEEFTRLMFDGSQTGRERREFYELYKAAHPEVTLETPDGGGAIAPEIVREQVSRELFGDLNTAILDIATEAGIPQARVNELRSQAQGPWSFLSAAFTEATKAAAEKERAKIRDEERSAAGKEAQARYSGKTIVTPRVLGQPGKPAKRDASRPRTWEEAAAEALASTS